MLIHALRFNAAFSTFSGLGMVFGSNWLAPHLALPSVFLLAVGVGLLLFAGYLLWMHIKAETRLQATPSIVVADAVWVVAVTGTAMVFREAITSTGLGIVIATSSVVALAAVLQFVGWRSEKEHSHA